MIKYLLGFIKNLFNPAVCIFAKIDNRSKISRKARLYSGAKSISSSVGDYSYIGGNTVLVHTTIGKYCSIAGDCHIGMGNHTVDYLSTSPIFTEKHNGTGSSWVKHTSKNPYTPIRIGNDVWIGLGVMIMGGVNIGDGAVIGAGSIVTKDVPPYAVVAGVPSRIIRYRFSEEDIIILNKLKWWDLPDCMIRK